MEQALTALKEQFDCPICRSPLTKPMQTSCNHLFCNFCLQELCKTIPALCPLCKKGISMRRLHPREDVEVMKTLVEKLCNVFSEDLQKYLAGDGDSDVEIIKDVQCGVMDPALTTLKEHFDCQICRSPLTKPIQTSCNHLFCSFCLEELCKKIPAVCPLCKKEISMKGLHPREDVEVMKTVVEKLCNDFSEDLKKDLSGEEKAGDGDSDVEIIKYVPCGVIDQALTALKEKFDCQICRSSLTKPTQTSCNHLFCNFCLQGLCKKIPAECPVCKKGISMKRLHPREDVEVMKKLVEKLCNDFSEELRKYLNGNEKAGDGDSEVEIIDFIESDGYDWIFRQVNTQALQQVKKASTAVITSEPKSTNESDSDNSSVKQRYIFCPTRLDKSQIGKLHELCAMSDGTVAREFSGDVTHLIINLQEGRIPQTLKYLLAIAARKWVVIYDWVEKCLEKGQMVQEDAFETSNFSQCDPGVQLSRLSETNLFEGYQFFFSSKHYKKSFGFTDEEVLMLLTLLGAKLVPSPNEVKGPVVIVGSKNENDTEYYNWSYTKRFVTITFEWIIKCILEYKIQPLTKQYLCITVESDDALLLANIPESLKEALENEARQKWLY